ncbi:MAG: hypothetical protein JNK85_02620 [Verrucomicrobiales bacterium]|nr:hypothetical protein [Verrucomicrobiales bacterium]
MTTTPFATVRTTRTQIEADLLISVLRDAGLHPLELETFGHVSFAGADIDYSVRVPGAELDEARAILAQFDSQGR